MIFKLSFPIIIIKSSLNYPHCQCPQAALPKEYKYYIRSLILRYRIAMESFFCRFHLSFDLWLPMLYCFSTTTPTKRKVLSLHSLWDAAAQLGCIIYVHAPVCVCAWEHEVHAAAAFIHHHHHPHHHHSIPAKKQNHHRHGWFFCVFFSF